MHADRVADAMKRAAKKAGKNPDSITALDAYKRFNLQQNGQMQDGALNQEANNISAKLKSDNAKWNLLVDQISSEKNIEHWSQKHSKIYMNFAICLNLWLQLVRHQIGYM